MKIHHSTRSVFTAPLVMAVVLPWQSVLAQAPEFSGLPLQSSKVESAAQAPTVLGATPIIMIQRDTEPKDLSGLYSGSTLNLNLGLEITPVNGLSVRADAWRLDVEGRQAPDNALAASPWQAGISVPTAPAAASQELGIDAARPTASFKLNGIDLGASYVWATEKTGQFTLSTKATYVQNYTQQSNLLEVPPTSTELTELQANPDLQGNLTLTWQYGNHTASAVTNYFDSVKDISELDINKINELVDEIVTFDLQYGYSVKAGREDRATFSFGIRNIFDRKTTQILDNSTRVVDQNGRVAYGSIKYQF
ncbi:MAG: hypothetical protein RLZZ385_1704 [Pseudomonadota bacterium]